MSTAVLALGGAALAQAGEPPTIANQFRRARESVGPIVELARQGWRIAIVHGNGPQVGDDWCARAAGVWWSRSRWECWWRDPLDRVHAAAVAASRATARVSAVI
jgi:carbamate kinase